MLNISFGIFSLPQLVLPILTLVGNILHCLLSITIWWIAISHSWSPEDAVWWLWWSFDLSYRAIAGQSFHFTTKISQHQIEWLAHFVQTFFVPRGWILLWWPADLFSSAMMRLTFVVFNEMFRQLLNGLPWNLLRNFMFPSEWIVLTLMIL